MVRLALLQCDTPVPAVKDEYGTYLDIFRALLTSSLERTRPGQAIEWSLDGYDVVLGEYPTDDKVKEYDGILLSGSCMLSLLSLWPAHDLEA